MPVDTSIYAQLQPGPAPVNPFAIAMQAQNMAVQRENAAGLAEQRRLMAEQRQSALDDRAALDAAVKPGADLDSVLANLPGHMHAAVRKQWGDADKAAQDARDAAAKASSAEADYFGTLAATVASYNYDPQAAQIVLAHAKAQGHDTSQIEALLQQNPNGLKQVVDGLIAASPKQRELATSEKSAATGARRLELETPKLQAEGQIAGQVAAGTVNGLTPDQQRQKQYQDAEIKQGAARLGLERDRLRAEQAGASSPMTDDALKVAAWQYIQTGAMPPLGMGKQAADARMKILNAAGQIVKAGGGDPVLNAALYKADAGALKEQQSALSAITAFENTAKQNLDRFITEAQKIVDFGGPFLNKPARYVATQLGDPKMASYNAALGAVQPEIARILTQPSLKGVLSDDARREAQKLLDSDASIKAQLEAIRILRADMASRKSNLEGEIKSLSGRISSRGSNGPAAGGGAPASGAPAPGSTTTIGRFKVEIR